MRVRRVYIEPFPHALKMVVFLRLLLLRARLISIELYWIVYTLMLCEI